MQYSSPMDLFRYFHPHYHPRLRKVPLRLQEIGELELAAKELSRALKRAQLRTESNAGNTRITSDQVLEVAEVVDNATQLLSELLRIHPGDSIEDIEQLIEERQTVSGWENWSRIVRERLNDSIILKRAVG